MKRRLATMAVAVAAFALLVPASAALADQPTLVSGTSYCRSAAVNEGYGVSIQPCQEVSSTDGYIETYVKVTGTATTDVRVYQAIAVVNANGTITDETASIFNDLYAKGRSSATFYHNSYANYGIGVHLVVDSWITNSGVRIGSVQSPVFTATKLSGTFDARNWAGFETTDSVFTSVNGTWTAPCVTGTVDSTHGYSSWIGLGGDGENLEQVGIAVQPDHTYRMWWEHTSAYPTNDPNNYVVHCGDVITATVSTAACASGKWWGYILDENTGKSYSHPCNTTDDSNLTIGNRSAEWIDEAPKHPDRTYYHLVNFGHTNWSGLSVSSTQNSSQLPPGYYENLKNSMQSGSVLLASPNQDSPGTSFTDTWYAAG